MRGYRFGVHWVAMNDDPGSPDALEVSAVAGYATTMLLSDIFEKDTEKVAKDIVRVREKEFRAEQKGA